MGSWRCSAGLARPRTRARRQARQDPFSPLRIFRHGHHGSLERDQRIDMGIRPVAEVTGVSGIRGGARLYMIIGASVCVACAPPARDDDSLVVLQAVGQLPLPDSAHVTGATIDSSQFAAVWGPHRLWLFDLGALGRAARELPIEHSTIIAARFRGAEIVTLQDFGADTVALHRVWPDRKEFRRWTIPVAAEVGIGCSADWYVGGRDASGFFHVYRLSGANPIPIWRASHASASIAPYFLSCLGTQIAVTDVLPPFQTVEIESSTRMSPTLDSTGLGSSASPRWVSSPLFMLGNRWLQVLADLDGDDRRLVIYGEDRQELRQRELAAPFGVLTTSDKAPLLLGTRQAKGTQVVLYQWRWANQM
jgi:hypothetical protein